MVDMALWGCRQGEVPLIIANDPEGYHNTHKAAKAHCQATHALPMGLPSFPYTGHER